jgi:hypothetical protein
MAEWLINYGSWCLAPFGLLGMWATGRKKTWGWLLSLTTQVLWAVYAVGTGQYGFLIGTCSYAAVYLKNWLSWRRDDAAPDVTWPDWCPYDCDRCHDTDVCECPNCISFREGVSP